MNPVPSILTVFLAWVLMVALFWAIEEYNYRYPA